MVAIANHYRYSKNLYGIRQSAASLLNPLLLGHEGGSTTKC
jgi:hypothetical protein